MTDRDTLLELAERCEAASGPDRELDALIWCALRPEYHVDKRDNGVIFVVKNKTERGGFYTGATSHTASIDAAMTLVPIGLGGDLRHVRTERRHTGEGRAIVLDTLGRGPETYSEAATPALALAAAALRAQASLISKDMNDAG